MMRPDWWAPMRAPVLLRKRTTPRPVLERPSASLISGMRGVQDMAPTPMTTNVAHSALRARRTSGGVAEPVMSQ